MLLLLTGWMRDCYLMFEPNVILSMKWKISICECCALAVFYSIYLLCIRHFDLPYNIYNIESNFLIRLILLCGTASPLVSVCFHQFLWGFTTQL